MKQKTTPELRFPEFIGDWNEIKLGQFGTFKNGINKNKEDFGFGIPFINLMDVFGKETIDANNLSLVNANQYEVKNYNLLKGDVLFIRSSVKKSGVGETSLVLEDIPNTVYSGFLIRYRSNENILVDEFKKFCFWTTSFRRHLISYSTTSANTNINQESLNKLKLHLPQIKEQQKIAEFLTAVDKRIQTLEKKKNLLEAYKKGLMQKIFNQEIRFKDDYDNDFPDWEKKRLGMLGKFIGGGTPSTSVPNFWNGDINWFTPTEIKTDYISESKRKITKGGLKNSSAKLLPKGTILITTRATIGEVAFATQQCSTNQGFQSIIVNNKNDSEFVFNLIKVSKNKILRRANGSTFLEISKKEIEKIPVIVPVLSEQRKIGMFLSAIDQKIEAVEDKLTHTQAYKKGLLQRMFV